MHRASPKISRTNYENINKIKDVEEKHSKNIFTKLELIQKEGMMLYFAVEEQANWQLDKGRFSREYVRRNLEAWV